MRLSSGERASPDWSPDISSSSTPLPIAPKGDTRSWQSRAATRLARSASGTVAAVAALMIVGAVIVR